MEKALVLAHVANARHTDVTHTQHGQEITVVCGKERFGFRTGKDLQLQIS
jgi:hypothetical protein